MKEVVYVSSKFHVISHLCLYGLSIRFEDLNPFFKKIQDTLKAEVKAGH